MGDILIYEIEDKVNCICAADSVGPVVPEGLNEGSQACYIRAYAFNIRRKPWSVPRLRGRGDQG
jgi:hypothetical protein